MITNCKSVFNNQNKQRYTITIVALVVVLNFNRRPQFGIAEKPVVAYNKMTNHSTMNKQMKINEWKRREKKCQMWVFILVSRVRYYGWRLVTFFLLLATLFVTFYIFVSLLLLLCHCCHFIFYIIYECPTNITCKLQNVSQIILFQYKMQYSLF